MMTCTRLPAAPRGFSLIEVMVAVLVISVGLLGIAKMQALAISNTGNARVRALAALEAAGFASAMQADRNYWTSVPTVGNDLTGTISAGTVTTASDTTLTTAQACTGGTVCTVAQMAAFDLQSWATELNNVIPNESVAIDCALPAPVAPATTSNVTCSIAISWLENLVNSNSAEQVNATTKASLQTPTYTLIVQP
ncbi:MAG: type IV pilus modification protein PilV [Steroidobacteraceae bacterium]